MSDSKLKSNKNNINNISNLQVASTTLSFTNPQPTYIERPQLAAVDSGCSSHTIRSDAHVVSKTHIIAPKICGTPTGHTMSSNMSAILDLPTMPKSAKEAHIYPNLQYRSLLSVGQLCDAGYDVKFNRNGVSAIDTTTQKVALQGFRDKRSGLYLTPLQPETPSNLTQPIATAGNVYRMRTQVDLAQYHHRSCLSPVQDTWNKAIEAGHFVTFPGLTSKLVTKHLPKSLNTTKGHAKRHRMNVRSTTTSQLMKKEESQQPSVRSNLVTFKTCDHASIIATDQTGRFPTKSSKGNQYIMIAHVSDPNLILAQPLKNRSAKSLLEGYTQLYNRLEEKGLAPLIQICDNECPAALRTFMETKGKLQLAPPYNHRTNPAEKAIDTFKAHFIAGLASVDPQFPLHLWCRLIPHAELTLNLVRKSNTHPQLSAWAHFNGLYDYNAHPLAPPGCKVIAYEGPSQRGTWHDRGTEGWYIGPSREHYRIHIIYIPKTHATRIGDPSTEFFPHDIATPKSDPRDNATNAALKLAEALTTKIPNLPYEALGDEQLNAIKQLSDIFSGVTKPNPTLPRVTPSAPTSVKQHRGPAEIPRVKTAPVTPHNHIVPASSARVKNARNTPPNNTPKPNVIPYDEDEVVKERYPLRSRMAASVFNSETGTEEEYTALAKGKNGKVWVAAYADDLGMLAQGLGITKGTNTIEFIPHTKVPRQKR